MKYSPYTNKTMLSTQNKKLYRKINVVVEVYKLSRKNKQKACDTNTALKHCQNQFYNFALLSCHFRTRKCIKLPLKNGIGSQNKADMYAIKTE